MLCVDAVGPLTLVGFEGFYGVAGLLHRAGHEAANRVFLPAHLVHDFGQRGVSGAGRRGHYGSARRGHGAIGGWQ